jgi:hypothetical protein
MPSLSRDCTTGLIGFHTDVHDPKQEPKGAHESRIQTSLSLRLSVAIRER